MRRDMVPSFIFSFLLIFIPSIMSDQGVPWSDTSETAETALIRHLVYKQTPSARPVYNKKDVVYVRFGVELVHIASVIENTQTIGVKVWLRMSWNNDLMRWKPDDWSNITSTRANPNTVWTPDLFLVEDISKDISSGPQKYQTQVIMDHSGIHYWYVPALLDSSCRFNVQNFPFDYQHCEFKFMSWTYDQTELDIIASDSPTVTAHYINSTEWDLQNVSSIITPKMYSCCPNPYVNIKFLIELRRKPLYYAYNVMVPCIIQMAIILCTFFLPPESGERIGVAITVLLVFAVYLEVLSHSLPKTSVSTPALTRFYLAAMAGSAFSIIATCFVLMVHFRGAEKGVLPMPYWVKKIFLYGFGNLFCVQLNLHTNEDDRLLSLRKVHPLDHSHSTATIENGNIGIDNKLNIDTQKNMKVDVTVKDELREVKSITELINDQNRQDEIEEQWMALGKVFDRIFFFMFLIYFLTTSLVIVLPIYRQHLYGYYQ